MKQKKLAVLIFIVLYGGNSIVFAEESLKKQKADSNGESLSAVTVIGDNDNYIDNTLWGVDSVKVDSVKNPAVVDFASALERQPSISFDFDGNGNVKYPLIRGMGENYTQIMLDGDSVPSYFTYGHGLYNSGERSFIEADTLKQIDIVKGRHSPKQSNGALAGTISVRTYNPSDFVSADNPYYFAIKSGYASRNESFGNTLTSAFSIGDFSGLLMYTNRNSHELDNQGSDSDKTRRSHIKTKQNNLLVKGEVDLSKGSVLFTGEHFKSDRTTTSRYSSNPAREEPTKRSRFSIRGEFHDVLQLDELQAKVSYQKMDNVSHYWSSMTNQFKLGDFKHKHYGFSLDAVKKVATGAVNHSFLFGVGFERTKFDFKRVDMAKSYRPLPLTTRDVSYFYGKDNMIFSNGFTLSPGIRIEHKKHSSSSDDLYLNNSASSFSKLSDDSKTTIAPTLTALFPVNDNLQLHASYSSGEKSADDVNYTAFGHAGSFIGLPNPDLKDETVNSYELGLDYVFNDKFDFSINAFYNKFDDFIASKMSFVPGIGSVYSPYNINKVKTHGVEVSSNIVINENFNAHLGATWVKGKQIGENGTKTPLLSAQPFTAVLGLNYQKNDMFGGDLSLRLASKGAKPQGNNEFRTPGYGVMDITAWWKPTKGMHLSGGIYNLFDKKYWNSDVNGTLTRDYYGPVNMARYTQPGRNFAINFKYEF